MAIYTAEKDVKRDVKKVLTEGSWMWWMPPANGFGASNTDFNAVRDGRFLAVETKFGKNGLTAQQRQYIHRVRMHGGIAAVVSEKTIEVFTVWMASWGDDAAPPMMPSTLL